MVAAAVAIEQFLDLNEHVGGVDDAKLTPRRTVADLTAVRNVYRTGRMLDGGAGLVTMPIIDYRAYADRLPRWEQELGSLDGRDARARTLPACKPVTSPGLTVKLRWSTTSCPRTASSARALRS